MRSWSARRLIGGGQVELRSFLTPAKLPTLREQATGNPYFVRGDLRQGVRPEEVLGSLVGVGVFPFLFATNGREVLLGDIPFSTRIAVPEAAAALLYRQLQGVEVSIFDRNLLEVPRYHEYVGLFAP